MLITASRSVPRMLIWALFHGSLFVLVVIAHAGLTGALGDQGLPGALAQTVSGALVLGMVLLALSAADWWGQQQERALEAARVRYRMPGPCSVVWREGEGENLSQWELVGPLRAHYPSLLRRLGVEGVTVIDFEVNAEGQAKNLRCLHAWPTDTFYEAARDALERAHFTPQPDIHVRYGESYQLPFVFRLSGASHDSPAGPTSWRELPDAAARLVDKFSSRSAPSAQGVELS